MTNHHLNRAQENDEKQRTQTKIQHTSRLKVSNLYGGLGVRIFARMSELAIVTQFAL